VGSVASDPTEARHDAEASASTTDQEQQSASGRVTGASSLAGGGRQASWTWSVTLISTVGLSCRIVLTTGSD